MKYFDNVGHLWTVSYVTLFQNSQMTDLKLFLWADEDLVLAGHVRGLGALMLHLQGGWQGLGIAVYHTDEDYWSLVLQLDLFACA